MEYENIMHLTFLSHSINEGFSRIVLAAFAVQLNPTLDELEDIKTAVSEAVTNAIIHGYENTSGMIDITAYLYEQRITIEVSDHGKGIENIELARQPLFTSCPSSERSGMGFTVMETFMDHIEIISQLGKGTTIRMKKRIESKPDNRERLQ